MGTAQIHGGGDRTDEIGQRDGLGRELVVEAVHEFWVIVGEGNV